ncbi:unnamed protein product [Rotaria sp. Silwood1]|nr:unnamed protein product [Rotaria sp. Silwood1]CAF1592064.1 unnamed protein product [Rotaria sp. Silwood1]
MTESTDSTTNYRPSDHNSDDDPIDWFVVLNHQKEHVGDDFGLFDDDDDSLTLFDLKSIPKSDHDLSIFDELEHQCDAVLLATNIQQNKIISTLNNNNNNSYLSNQVTTTTTTMMNDYERRFECSLQKLTIPSWYINTIPSPKIASKPMINITNQVNQQSHRTPEIVHVQRPRSYRSCRSSLGTSPTPSIHSWHPNHIMDGMNFSSVLPLSPYTSSRRRNKYEKGIERVIKSSHWYRPTQFANDKKNDHFCTTKISFNQPEKLNYNHYDIPKVYYDDKNNISNDIKEYFISDQNITSRSCIQSQSKYLINDIDFDNEKISFGRIELEEISDDEENDKRSLTNNIHKLSTVEVIDNKENDRNTLLEHIASNLVDSILNDALLSEKLNHDNNNDDDDDDTNTGVRELSDDEEGLRELDENDMNGTDEFIVFATKTDASDHDDDNENDNDNNNQTSSIVPRGSLNRLYTFSRTNDDTSINSKTQLSNQESTTSELMIVDKNALRTNSLTNIDSNQSVNTMINLDDNNNSSHSSSPVYRSHIQKRHINLGRYYDGMLRGTNSQIPIHDLRCNLALKNIDKIESIEGVNEETIRQGRILLDSIPNSIDINTQSNENVQNESMPTRSILKNTRFSLTDEINEKKSNDNIIKIAEKTEISPKKIITTTITEEYRRIQRRIIEEFTEEYKDKICQNFDYLKQPEQYHHTQQSLIPYFSINDQSPYELLSECYSGYSFIRSDFLTPITTPLTLNVSSLQSTTDEAYESEPTTTSPRSPTISSSPTTMTTYVHPNLLHEFEYPSPPPPVPDRRLKPAHLRPPPPIKPRSHQQQKNSNDFNTIDKIQLSPLKAIEHLMATTPNDSTSSSVRTLSSRHYCGSLPLSNELVTSSESQTKLKQDSRIDNTLNSSTNNDYNQKDNTLRKSTTSSVNRNRSKKPSSTYFDEATNGLAIRLLAPMSEGPDLTNKQTLNRSSTPSSSKRVDGTIKKRPISENLHLDRSSIYETSV